MHGHSREASRDGSDTRSITSDPQRVVFTEAGIVSCAGGPPVSGGVDDWVINSIRSVTVRNGKGTWVATSLAMVSVGETGDPGYHRGVTQAIAFGAVRVV